MENNNEKIFTDGKYYGQINNWQPNQNDVVTNTDTTSNDNQSDDLPF